MTQVLIDRATLEQLVVALEKHHNIAVIFTGRKQKYLGTFTDKYEAHAAYLNAKRLMHEGCSI